jgi:hypothetical protein
MAAQRRACSDAGGDQQDAPGGSHYAVFHPAAQGLLDGGERSLPSAVVSIAERLANPARTGTGHGDLGNPVLTDHDVIGMRGNRDRTESGGVQPGADPAGIGQRKWAGLIGGRAWVTATR